MVNQFSLMNVARFPLFRRGDPRPGPLVEAATALTTISTFTCLSGLVHDLNGMLSAGTTWYVQEAITINDLGQILADGCPGTQPCASTTQIVLTTVTTKTRRRR